MLISGEFLTPLPLTSIASPSWNPKSHSSQKAVNSETLQSPSAIPITSAEQGHHRDKHILCHIYDFRKTSSAELWLAFHLNRKPKLTLWFCPLLFAQDVGITVFPAQHYGWALCSLGRICNIRLKDNSGSPDLQISVLVSFFLWGDNMYLSHICVTTGRGQGGSSSWLLQLQTGPWTDLTGSCVQQECFSQSSAHWKAQGDKAVIFECSFLWVCSDIWVNPRWESAGSALLTAGTTRGYRQTKAHPPELKTQGSSEQRPGSRPGYNVLGVFFLLTWHAQGILSRNFLSSSAVMGPAESGAVA